MAHARTQTVARPAADLSLRLSTTSASLIDEHSAHQQSELTVQQRREAEEAARIAALPNPEWWPTTRAVPHYRPLNRQMDTEHRPFGRSGPERVFVTLMLGGVWVQGVIRTAWQWSGSPGRSYFKYDVGGLF